MKTNVAVSCCYSLAAERTVKMSIYYILTTESTACRPFSGYCMGHEKACTVGIASLEFWNVSNVIRNEMYVKASHVLLAL